ncbi:MAG: dTDP-4-dehydrorhamnose reductase [Bacteroidetes bacterium]|nr:MAG: dTDP-4-dehydrorhamnose reductase [Bacteroidota bacterium]
MMKKILLTGAHGQLGKSILGCHEEIQKHRIFSTDVESLDITDDKAVDFFFKEIKPDILINTAAYTNVEGAEKEERLATKINGEAPGLLAALCKKYHTLLIHLSTDYVFDGTQKTGYLEMDPPNPLNAYGRSKLAGERAIANAGAKALIIRTSWLYSEFENNFIHTMLQRARANQRLRVINDQYGSPTYAGDLAKAILFLSNLPHPEETTYFHVANRGYTSWYHLAAKAFEYSGLTPDLTATSTEDYATAAQRPAYSILNTNKLNTETHFTMPTWEEGLKQCIDRISQQNL